ncbi:unannotated protein [freshwater metagenome]|uniref:Unannotated protein n=1 Tax=freshwater metagenome TaxID=449393 RepID=A0A6J6NAV4_9ZZZZ
MGSRVIDPGASFCNSARVPATMTAGAESRWRMRHIVRMREPIVSTAGLTRSKGSVSHDGKNSMASAPRKAARSSAIDCAIVPVGVAMTIGRRVVLLTNAASTAARATSGTARTESRCPAIASIPGSLTMCVARTPNGREVGERALTVRCSPASLLQARLKGCFQ